MTRTMRVQATRRRRPPMTTMMQLEEPAHAATSGGLSDIPIHVLYLVADILDISDLVSMSAVSKVWRKALLDDFRTRQVLTATSSPHHLPKLMFPSNSGDKDFIHLSMGQHFQLNFPELKGVKFCGSGHGWLVLLAVNKDFYWQVQLFNPFTKEQIGLPDHPWLLSLTPADQFMFKAIIIGNPSESQDYSVAAIISTVISSVSFVTARSGRLPKWTTIMSYEQPQSHITDIVYNRGILYTISGNLGFIRAYIMKKERNWWDFRWGSLLPQGMLGRYPHYKSYLLEASGRVYGVVRSLQLAGDPEPRDGSLVVCTLKHGHREWARVEELGNCCFMLGDNSSMAISPVPAKSGFRRNCVYFTRSHYSEKEIGEYDLAEYCLKDGKYQLFSFEKPAADYSLSPALWLTFNRSRAA